MQASIPDEWIRDQSNLLGKGQPKICASVIIGNRWEEFTHEIMKVESP